ncbi:hypothetical protein AV530_004768 [Patagioenas fasciata monilis]|uniref:Uncharacterized protein n=1 Tax=Patagioenas fasciata monilis TaxID=372326 RepID=A0A1V4KDZ1_PATFA|nr:hypothetical protein AV530_004768 [Patagioenas fasciata monilis]
MVSKDQKKQRNQMGGVQGLHSEFKHTGNRDGTRSPTSSDKLTEILIAIGYKVTSACLANKTVSTLASIATRKPLQVLASTSGAKSSTNIMRRQKTTCSTCGIVFHRKLNPQSSESFLPQSKEWSDV